VKHWWNDVQPPMLDTHLRLHVLLTEGQTGEAWEPQKKQRSFGNRRALDRKVLPLRIQRSAPVAVPLIPPIPQIKVERR